MTLKLIHLWPLALVLSACSQDPAGVRISHDVPPAPEAQVSRVEPIFYNGRTYKVSLSPAGNGQVALAIAGMTEAQGKDAAGLSSSALFHFACKDTQKAQLSAPPTYAGGTWKSEGHCS